LKLIVGAMRDLYSLLILLAVIGIPVALGAGVMIVTDRVEDLH